MIYVINFVGVDAHIDPKNNNNGPMWVSAPTTSAINLFNLSIKIQTNLVTNKSLNDIIRIAV